MLKLSIIIPVYNEQSTISRVIEEVSNAKMRNIAKEILVVDDCSTDKTRDILKKIKDKKIKNMLKDTPIKIFFHKKNLGKGAAIKTGLENSAGDIILIQDADLEYSPSEYKKLLKPIIDGNADVVYGSRLDAIIKNIKNMYKLHYIGNKFLTFITNLLYGASITDMETGYKVFRKEVIKGINLRADRFDFEPEVTAKILKKGYKIYEVPISFVGRKFDEGKKITWVDGIKAVYYLIKYKFVD